MKTVILVLLVILVGSVSPAAAQRVVSGEDEVVVDGNLVRIKSGDDMVVVSGDWRLAGKVYSATDTDRVLVELGAVVADDQIKLDLAGDILFSFGSAEILPAAEEKLAKVAHLIRNRSVGEVYVVGHTDSIGSDAQNLKLSRERALAVMRWLRHQEGIPFAIMVGSGMGSKKPIAYNTMPDGSDNPEGRAKNRRVEVQMATREGVTIQPGVTITDDEVRVGGVVVDAGGVSVGGVRIDTGEVQAKAEPAPVAASGACEALCKATAGSHSFSTIACMEGAFEELGFDMDSDSCDELEDAMASGFGNSGGSLCRACVKAEGLSDAQCAVVARCIK